MCVSARVGSPVCTDSLNKHQKYLKSFSFPVYVCACVFGMTTTRTSLKIPPLHARAFGCLIPIIGCCCTAALLHAKSETLRLLLLLCALCRVCVLAALLNIVQGAVAPCWL